MKRFKMIDVPKVMGDMYRIYPNGKVYNDIAEVEVNITTDSKGYQKVSLARPDKGSTTITIHRLLALHFIKKTKADIKYDRDMVRFIDGDKSNIDLSNLEWVNGIESNIKTNLRQRNITKISDMVPSIAQLLEKNYQVKDIITVLGVSSSRRNKSFIKKIKARKIYAEETAKYQF